MNKIELSHKEHQEIMLKLMISFDRYCSENQLQYYLTGGTLLGAVRHKGFIPWDDDVDVVMPRDDYDKLLRASQIDNDVEIVSIENDHGYYHPFPHANIVDRNTIMLEEQVKKQTGKGVFIDVFPLDGVPDERVRQEKLIRKLMFLQSVSSNKISVSPGFSSIKNSLKTVLGNITFFIDDKELSRYINKVASKYKYNESNYVAHLILLLGNPKRFITPKEDYSDYILLDFEGYQFRCPIGYKHILKRSY